ncbi:hypothetical protein HDU91_005065 [Kappamyces sp. JEL0680]|nr:hypothetical protein HDU91_005065 [Kappamyces sp. JEL0680]
MSLGFSYICQTAEGSVVSDLLFPMHSLPPAVSASAATTTDGPTPYTSVLTPFDYNKLNALPKTLCPKGVSTKPYPSFLDESTFEQAVSVISGTRTKISTIFTAYSELQERCDGPDSLRRVPALVHENKLQTTVLENSQARIKGIASRVEKMTKRMQILKASHKEQTQKMSALLELAYDLTQPRLSAAEIQWFQELALLYSRLERHFVPMLIEQAKAILEQNRAAHIPEILGTQQIRDVKASLSHEYKELKALTKKVSDLHLVADSLE